MALYRLRACAIVCLLASVAAAASASSDVIMPPIKSGPNPAALVFIQGASVPPEDYVPMMQALQSAFPNPLWCVLLLRRAWLSRTCAALVPALPWLSRQCGTWIFGRHARAAAH